MTIPKPDHLIEQAWSLSRTRARQVDHRRAISAAYYAVFHAIMTAAADESVGVRARGSARYALIYRAVDHVSLKRVCGEIVKDQPSLRWAPYLTGVVDDKLRILAAATIDLQEWRSNADYNPTMRFSRSLSGPSIRTAELVVGLLGRLEAEPRKAFLTLLLVQPR